MSYVKELQQSKNKVNVSLNNFGCFYRIEFEVFFKGLALQPSNG